jgi:flagellar protein FliO/FliZ
MIDTRHKIYLLRRDDREHLVLVGPEGASVVENGIAAPAVPVVLHLHDGARG